MAYNQINAVINAATKQMTGVNAIANVDTRGLVDVGGQILSNDGLNIVPFMNGLMGVIRDTYIKAKAYDRREKISARRSADAFGLYTRKIQRKNIADAKENSSYKAQDWNYYNGTLTQNWDDRLFGKVAGYETEPVIIADKQLEKCFHNAAEMASFIDMLYTGMSNDVEAHAETSESLARAAAIASCMGNARTVVNLSTLYAAAYPNATAITSANWETDPDFIRFAIVQIKKIARNMRTFNRVYNNGGADRFSREDELIIDVHSNFVASMEGYLESTLIEKFIALPTFNEVTRWQASGTTSQYLDATGIDVTIDDFTAGTKEGVVEKSAGIIAFVHDIDKYALTVDDLRTVNARNSLQEMTTSVTKYDVAYAVDTSEQGVVFIVNDAA